jgi:signal transduction histidine kinase
MIVGGNRKAIFHQFREYENRLIAATRAQSRTSLEFEEAQKVIQDRIRTDFYAACKVLRDSIHSHLHRKQILSQQYDSIAPLLLGEELRKLSRSLDIASARTAPLIRLGKRRDSFNLFIQQFRLLYTSIARSTPLHMRSYAFMLIALVTPPFINFYSLSEFLISYPILLLVIFGFAHLIVKTQSGKSLNALRNASLLIFLTGFIPLTVNLIGQSITHNPQTQFPLFITALALPVTYYISMELLQVLRPGSLNLIRNDQLMASPVLQKKVEAIVQDDFSQTLSHQWAVFIHGKTLTRLGATSLKLKAAALAGDTRTFDNTLEALLTSLENPDAEFEQVTSDLQTELSSRLDPWRGFVDIKLNIAEELASMRNLRVRVIGEVIEELLSNSIRHGKAKEIELRVITTGDKEIDIIAVDDATIAPTKSLNRAGLGTRIFNLASDGRWSITRVGSSTQFKLRMSIEK